MGILVPLLVLAGGLTLLMVAADRFVAGASDLAARLRVPPIVIGAVVLGFGTSAPELVVSTMAAAQQEVDLGLGNIVGSNVANLTLVLGLAALIRPIDLPTGTKRRALVCLVSVALFGWLVQGSASVGEGILLLGAMVVALILMVRMNAEEVTAPDPIGAGPLGMAWVWTVGGLVVTVASAQAVVWAATDVAERAGLAHGFVGFSLVAVGTSLPELMTVVAAARRDEAGLILGSLLGSNVFNSLCVGAGLFLAGNGVVTDVALQTRGSIAAMVVAFVMVIFMRTMGSNRLSRIEGAVLLGGYAVVLAMLATSAGTCPASHDRHLSLGYVGMSQESGRLRQVGWNADCRRDASRQGCRRGRPHRGQHLRLHRRGPAGVHRHGAGTCRPTPGRCPTGGDRLYG